MQVRQKADHPRTLLALEQHMLKHDKARAALREVKREGGGLDFFFGRRQDAHRFAMGICALAPCKCKASSNVVSANAKTGTSNVKHVWAIEIAPLCRDDLVLLPRGVAPSLSPLALVSRIGAMIHLVDPTSGATAELTADSYWACPFGALGTKRHLSTFVVLDCEPVVLGRDPKGRSSAGGSHQGSLDHSLLLSHGFAQPSSGGMGGGAAAAGSVAGSVRGSTASSLAGSVAMSASSRRGGYVAAHWAAAEATVARESDFGSNDEVLSVRTHLGGVFEAGDEATGYDLVAMAYGIDDPRVNAGTLRLPEAVLVAKMSAKQVERSLDKAAAGGRSGATNKSKKEGGRRRATRRPLGGSVVSSTGYQESLTDEEVFDLEGLDRAMMEEGGSGDEAEEKGTASMAPIVEEGEENAVDGVRRRASHLRTPEPTSADGGGSGARATGVGDEAAGEAALKDGVAAPTEGGAATTEGGATLKEGTELKDGGAARTEGGSALASAASAWLFAHAEDHTGVAADLNQYWYSAATIATILQVESAPPWPIQDLLSLVLCGCKNQSSLYYPRPFALPTLLQYYCATFALYNLPPTLPVHAIHHTILVMPISCKGSAPPADWGARPLSLSLSLWRFLAPSPSLPLALPPSTSPSLSPSRSPSLPPSHSPSPSLSPSPSPSLSHSPRLSVSAPCPQSRRLPLQEYSRRLHSRSLLLQYNSNRGARWTLRSSRHLRSSSRCPRASAPAAAC